jgi:hypothetical protein
MDGKMEEQLLDLFPFLAFFQAGFPKVTALHPREITFHYGR